MNFQDPSRGAPRRSIEASRAVWRAAASFADLCRAGARFATGELSFFPGWNAPDLDEESDPLRARLARWNEAGFLTTASQPASADQHAFVSGFASAATAGRLLAIADESGLRVVAFGAVSSGAHGPGEASVGAASAHASFERAVPVSFHGEVAHAFVGHDARADEIVCFEDHVDASALDALRAATFLHAWDERRGRDEVLWRAIDAALGGA